MSGDRYAGWFAVDIRLLIFVVLISAFMALGVVALTMRGKRWYEYLSAYVGIFVALLTMTVVVFNQLASYPVFVIKEFFPFP
jgi:hypothetical protein